MTKFVGYFNLCPIPDPKEFLGLAPDREEGNVIATLGRNIAIVMKISTQKQMHSWSVVEKLTSKVVYDRCSEKYVGVFSQRAIRCWDAGTKDVNKAKKLKFQKTIVDLVVSEEDTFVLYGDGSFEKLAEAIQSRKDQVDVSMQQMELTPLHTLSHASVHTRQDGQKILTYFERHNERGDLVLVCFTLTNEQDEGGSKERQAQRFSIRRGGLDVRVSGYAVVEGNSGPLLLSIWSDKRIFLLPLNESTLPESSPGKYVSMLTALKVDAPVTVLGVSRNFVAIYGANSGQEGASLLLYNIQFKVINAKQFFKVYFDYSRMWLAHNEYLLLAMGQNLAAVSYRVSKDLLAELVGSQINEELQRTVEGDHINEEELLQDCLQLKVVDKAEEESDFIGTRMDFGKTGSAPQADGKTIPFESPEEFNREFCELSRLQMHVDTVQVERAMEDVQIALMNNFNDDGFLTSDVQLIAHQLERCGASEQEISEKLLTVLLKAELLDDIQRCLRRYSNIPEKILVKTLSYTLEKLLALEQSTQNEDSREKHQQLLGTLHTLLSCDFDSRSIVRYLRRDLSYDQVLLLLEQLYCLLTTKDDHEELERPSFTPNCVKLELQLLTWFGLLINAHVQGLILSKDNRLVDLLLKWSQLVTSYKNDIVELQEVLALLYNIVDKKDIYKGATCSQWYYIEEVTW